MLGGGTGCVLAQSCLTAQDRTAGYVKSKSSLCAVQKKAICYALIFFPPFIPVHRYGSTRVSFLNTELSNIRVKIKINGLID